MARKARKSPPIPEVLNRLRGRKWQVAEGEKPKADLSTGVMTVPLDDSDASAWVRRHEMARLTWSPDAPITDPYEQAFEEARLNLLTKKLGLPTDTYREDVAVTAHIAAQALKDVAASVLTRVALTATSDEAVANQTLAAVDPAVTQAANEALTLLRKRPTFAGVQEAAAYLRKRVTLSRRPPKGAPRPEGEPGPGRPGDGDGKPIPGPAPKLVLPPTPKPAETAMGKAEDDQPATGDKSREAKRRDEAKKREAPIGVVQFMPTEGTTPHPFHPRSTGPARWGTMTVETPPLPLRLPRRVGKGKWRPADMGAVPRRMERWSVDQAVFSTRGRQRAGTVLVDGSGSMGLSHAQILDVLLKAPAASVAVYSGGRYLLDGQETTLETYTKVWHARGGSRLGTDLNGGRLQILARRGRRVRAIPPRGVANVVDGPALRWLARQKAPRLWVSDMEVTGVDECQSDGLIQQARDICRTFGIKVVPDVTTAIRLLGGAKQRISKH